METLKTCSKCGQAKPLDDFYKRTRSRDGLEPICKNCGHAKNIAYKKHRYSDDSEWRAKNIASSVEWKKMNPDKALEQRRRYVKKHAKQVSDNAKIRYHSDPSVKTRKLCSGKEARNTLTDAAVVEYLGRRTNLNAKDIRMLTELIEAKRVHLKLTRKLKELKK